MLGYGRVRPLWETMRILKLQSGQSQTITESRQSDPEKEKLDKKRLIEQARQRRKEGTTFEKPASLQKDKFEAILESIDAVEKEIKEVAVPPPDQAKPSLSGDLKEVVDSLTHIKKFSESVVKRYGWRTGDKEKIIYEIFAAIRDEANNQLERVTKGWVTEEAAARTESQKLIKQFVEAVGYIKDQFQLNQIAYSELKKWAETVK
jgi:hypothetical protein